MKTLLKNVHIIDSFSDFHLQTVNVLIDNDIIGAISATNIPIGENVEVIESSQYSLSTGWVDMCVYSGESGAEHKETFVSLSQAAQAGGFTDIAIHPNTTPIVQTKEMVRFVKAHSNPQLTLHPIAALSINLLGEEMTDFLDLHAAGAVAFSDGLQAITNTAMLTKSLLYLQHIDGLLMNRPDDKYLSKYGLMHEGEISTYLGLKGMPAIAEVLGIVRDLKILAYTGGKIHFSTISTAESVQLIREAKQQGLQVTCDIAAHQLAFLDSDLQDFDTNLKVNPPLRTEKDRQALLAGLQDDTIDCIVSAHTPCDEESKAVEFDMADFGMIGLQTCFAAARTATKNILTLQKLIEKFTINPRKILQLSQPAIKVNKKTKLTLFSPNEKTTLSKQDILSLSYNSPFIGKQQEGKVIRTFGA
jgi:dihydroorotase